VMTVAVEKLRREVAIRGWDQRSLARAAGVSEGTVSRALSGRRVRAVTALQIVQALRRQPVVPELAELVAIVVATG